MSSAFGLHRLSQRIATRGLSSPLRKDERAIVIGSSSLKVVDSDVSPYFMTTGVMTDLLYGLADVLFTGHWYMEATIDIWSGNPQKHVGHGYLINRYTPGRAVAATNGNSRATTARQAV